MAEELGLMTRIGEWCSRRPVARPRLAGRGYAGGRFGQPIRR